jgi:membrane protein
MIMKDFPRGGLVGQIRFWCRRFGELKIGIHASSASFFLVMSVFPILLLLLGLLRYTPLGLGALFEMAAGFLPEALLPYAEDLIRGIYDNSSAGLVSVSALAALWSASRGIHGLMTGLRAVYAPEEDRGYLRARIGSLGYTFAFLGVLVLTPVLQVFGTVLVESLRQEAHPFIRFLAGLLDLRSIFLLGLQTCLFTAMYTTADGTHAPASASVPGALLASLGWMVFTHLYSAYIDHFGDRTHIYGSVYTVALSMLWLYFCVSILFYGAALNRFLSIRQER